LFDDERERLDRQGWEAELGTAAYVRLGRNWVLNKRGDGACVFLDESNRCRIHSRFGEQAKPLACRMFPFSVRPVDEGWQASLRFDCPSVTGSKGQPIGHYREAIAELTRRLDHRPPFGADTGNFSRRIHATRDELDRLTVHFKTWVRDVEFSMADRLIGAARVTQTLARAKFEKVRGDRFGELLDLLFGALHAEVRQPIEPPTRRQRGLLRQLAFAHAEHVTITEMAAGFFDRMKKRYRQLRAAGRFRAGRGMVPPLPGFPGAANFDAVERATIFPDDALRIDELLGRYVAARLEGGTVYGPGYYGWPVFSGLAALWLAIAAAGWLGRLRASTEGRTVMRFDDAAYALGVVDRAATRLPALGAAAERVRVSYLLRDDGVARLVRTYAPLTEHGREG